MPFVPVLLLLVLAVCAAGTAIFVRLSRRQGILDVPNERSMHAEPVPVGAGLVISATVLAALLVYFLMGSAGFNGSFARFAAYFIASAVLVAVSWLDDLSHVPAWVRFGIHALAALAILWFSPVWEMESGFRQWSFAGAVFIWMVGFTNAFNFMDGSDGIAGSQAVATGLGWGVLGAVLGSEAVSFAGFAIAAACAAFLYFNWEPAKVFMGDSGSAFLGFSFAAFPIFVIADLDPLAPGSADRWLIVLYAVALTWPFVFDSSVTFFRRLLKGERVWEPHRKHLYQAMVMRGMPHSAVAALYGLSGIVCSAAVIVSAVLETLFPVVAAVAFVSLALPFAAHLSGGITKRRKVGEISELERN
ncbi:MAG: glycosyltransferase family 4 protein [Acidobacteriota bacterium]|nr:MAG: glycosyltransferase family 4 protein [Acidobacteriota bacterium]